jgi:hypothetical protein
MATISNKFSPKSPTTFECIICDFKCSYRRDYERHIQTKKHNKQHLATFFPQNAQKKYQCEKCIKQFNDRSGLWRHKKKCSNELVITDKEMINILVKQNEKLMKLIENGTNNTTNNTTNNNNNTTNNDNKTFNLSFFLNETCKNAININDFVSSIKVNLEDLENTGRQGYIQGISNIILKKLNNLEQHMRPLHCSNSKQEVLYIKNNDEWTKEAQNKPILTKAIKTIANENIKQIKHWKDKYSDCSNSDSKKNDLYLKIVSNSMNGLTEEESNKNIGKIISNVAKEVMIDK